MPELSVVIVATDNEQRALLQVLVDGTSVARTAHSCASFPVGAADPVIIAIIMTTHITKAKNTSEAVHAINIPAMLSCAIAYVIPRARWKRYAQASAVIRTRPAPVRRVW